MRNESVTKSQEEMLRDLVEGQPRHTKIARANLVRTFPELTRAQERENELKFKKKEEDWPLINWRSSNSHQLQLQIYPDYIRMLLGNTMENGS